MVFFWGIQICLWCALVPYVKTSEGKFKPLKRTVDEVFTLIEKQNVKFIDLQFTDLPGKLQHTTVPTSGSLEPESFIEGIPKLDGSSIRGFVEIFESDLLLRPDPSTFAVIPWIPEDIKTARMICDVQKGFGGGRLSRDPRGIAQKAEQTVKEMGYDLSYWGPEAEFFVFDKVSWDVMQPYKGQGYRIESREGAWSSDGTSYPIRFKEGYFPAEPQDTLTEYRSEVVRTLEEDFSIVCDAHHHEVATAGQCEIDMRYDTLTPMADSVMTYKYVTKNIAKKRGMIATFMPKPIFMDNASGMHVNSSIWKAGTNLFYDAHDDYAELSQLGRYYTGGLLEHGRALSLITAPTTNSYKRLVPGYEAPVYLAWSRSNRSAAIRIPVYQKGKANAAIKRIEFRPPDPAANPYLCFAAIVAAGADGIKKKIEIGDPVDEDIYKLTVERRRQLGIKELPGSLEEAIEAFESDSEFVKGIFSSEVIESIEESARKESQQVALRPHPYEFYLYFDI